GTVGRIVYDPPLPLWNPRNLAYTQAVRASSRGGVGRRGRRALGIRMATTDPAAQASPISTSRTANEFSIQVATVNGSGSQTANLILIRSLFQMGIPVSGKNLFPSNIAGLPTWYTIRANRHGYNARKKEIDRK